jgi:hypothetical protein
MLKLDFLPKLRGLMQDKLKKLCGLLCSERYRNDNAERSASSTMVPLCVKEATVVMTVIVIVVKMSRSPRPRNE